MTPKQEYDLIHEAMQKGEEIGIDSSSKDIALGWDTYQGIDWKSLIGSDRDIMGFCLLFSNSLQMGGEVNYDELEKFLSGQTALLAEARKNNPDFEYSFQNVDIERFKREIEQVSYSLKGRCGVDKDNTFLLSIMEGLLGSKEATALIMAVRDGKGEKVGRWDKVDVLEAMRALESTGQEITGYRGRLEHNGWEAVLRMQGVEVDQRSGRISLRGQDGMWYDSGKRASLPLLQEYRAADAAKKVEIINDILGIKGNSNQVSTQLNGFDSYAALKDINPTMLEPTAYKQESCVVIREDKSDYDISSDLFQTLQAEQKEQNNISLGR